MSLLSKPFSIKSDSSAFVRAATDDSGSGYCPVIGGGLLASCALMTIPPRKIDFHAPFGAYSGRALPSCRLEITPPQVKIPALVRFGRFTPELPPREAPPVDVLGALATSMGICVWEHVCIVDVFNHTALPSDISCQARMACGIDGAGHNLVT